MPSGHWLDVRVAAVALLLASLIAILVGRFTGLVVLVGGAAIAGVCTYILLRRRSDHARAHLPVPLHPKVSNVSLTERLAVRIALQPDGQYTVEADPVDGEVTATLTVGRHDRDRVVRHVRKRRLGAEDEVQYAAGSLVLRGQACVVGLESGAVLPIGGSARSVPALGALDAPASSNLPFTRTYRLSPEPDHDNAPLWITPSIVPDNDRYVLELAIQWPDFGRDRDDLFKIDLLRIDCPVRWGSVKGVSRGMASVSVGDAPEGGWQVRKLQWEHLALTEAERRERRLTMRVEFEHQVEAEDDLSGHLEATVGGSLSGVDGIALYNALGENRKVSEPIDIKIRFDADFGLSLASIRYQAVRVCDNYGGEYGTVPDHRTVIALTNALAGAGYYVKRVLDNPPHTGGQADVVQRYWDIAGRHYLGVYPVDFHLVLTGEERHSVDVLPETGSTKVRIVVSGPYTDQPMYDGVEEEWTRLHDLMDEALKGRGTPGGAANGGEWRR